MAKRKSRQTPEQDSDYDGAWKEALRQHFHPILGKYFPAMAAAIDWNHQPEWADKELGRVLGRSRQRPRSVDVLAKVRLRDGGEQWILLHLEIQSGRETGFEPRIARYNGGLFFIFEQRVATLVVLADLDEDWRPSEDVFRVADFESRLRFPVCKLIDKLDGPWRDDHSLPVQIARAQIEALRTATDPEGRYRAKWQLVRNLYGLGYNADEVRELFRLIDWMMHLREDLSQRFEQELTAFEESLNMPYITSVERIAEARGEARGEAQGRVEGGATILLRQLVKLCGPLPQAIEDRVRRLSLERLAALGEAVFDFRSLQDLQSWLDAHEPTT
ncbi:MAG: DUF4351 domain-containing protein [Thermoguttaceae bacterium]|jgi:hypothetical protein|nr:DUF4351 domain-containing protein [Thermoguttaceae bacterium]